MLSPDWGRLTIPDPAGVDTSTIRELLDPYLHRTRTSFQTDAEYYGRVFLVCQELSRRGMTFVGPTICYALMQSVGLVNDHTMDCFRYRELRSPAKRRTTAGSRS